jgi:hypothetical protein
MALNGNAYAVDLARMRSACGSKDESLLSDVLEHQADLFACYADQLDDEDESGYSFRQALTDIIEGEYRAPKSRRFLYGYAIEVFCRHFGEVIPVPGDEQFNEIGDPEDLEIDSPLVDGELPLPVPSWGDTPYVRFLTPEQVVQEAEKFSKMDLPLQHDCVTEGRETLLYQLRWAGERGRSFVTVVNG